MTCIIIVFMYSLYKKDLISFGYILLILLMVLTLEITGVCLYWTYVVAKDQSHIKERLYYLEKDFIELFVSNNEVNKTEKINDVLNITQSQLSNHISAVNTVLLILSIVVTLMTIAIPVMNYAFLNKDQIEIMTKNVDKKVDGVMEKVLIQSEIYKSQNVEIIQGINLLNQLISEFPHSADIYIARGDLFNKNKQYELALHDYCMADSLNEFNYDLKSKIIDLNFIMKDYNSIITICNDILELDSSFYDAYLFRGMAYYEKGDYDNSYDDYEMVIKMEPDNSNAYYYRSILNEKNGKIDQAKMDIDQAIMMGKNNKIYYKMYFEKAKLQKDNKDEAIELLTNSITLNSEFTAAYKLRGDIYLEIDEYELAIKDFTSALKYGDIDLEIYFKRGFSYYENDDEIKAIEDFTNVIVNENLVNENNKDVVYWERIIHPMLARARYYRALSYFEMDEYQNSMVDLNYILEHYSNYNFPVQVCMARIYKKQQNYLDMIDVLENCNDNSKWKLLGYAYYKNKQYLDAISCFNLAISYASAYEGQDRDIELYFYRGDAYFFNGKYQEAENDYQKAIQEKSKGLGKLGMARIYEVKKDYNAAINSLSEYINSHSRDIVALKMRERIFLSNGENDLALNDREKIDFFENNSKYYSDVNFE